MNANVVMAAEGTIEEQERNSTIKEHPFFDGLTAHQYRLLSDCAMQTHFNSGDILLRTGAPADHFYLIQTGKIVLELHTHRGLELIHTLGSGDVLGWSWLFPPYSWHFDARALEPSNALCIHASSLREECESDHELGHALTKKFAALILKRLQITINELMELRRNGRGLFKL